MEKKEYYDPKTDFSRITPEIHFLRGEFYIPRRNHFPSEHDISEFAMDTSTWD